MDDEPVETSSEVPKWMVTFADLSTLLLCFFVLLLSFSEMDVAKFKQLAGSMREAFGVQQEIKVKHIPKGTSIIAQEFSPGRPEKTVLNEIRQFTVDSSHNTLRTTSQSDLEKLHDSQQLERQAALDAALIAEALHEEVRAGKVIVHSVGVNTVIQILEESSFESASPDVKEEFVPVLDKIHDLLVTSGGDVRIAGHTDNLPISTYRFRSNWELSAARAVSVLHVLLQSRELDPARFLAAGYADTKPIASNDDASGRAKNRRVDIAIIRGGAFSKTVDPSNQH